MLEHRESPARHRGPRNTGAPDPELAVVDRGLLLLQADRDRPLLDEAVSEELGIRLPAARTASASGSFVLLWLAPGEWLLEMPRENAAALGAKLQSKLCNALVAVTDASDAFEYIELAGARALDVLATGCSLDLRSFPVANVARTLVAGVPAIIWKPQDAHRFHCLVDRSFAEHFWSWIVERPARW